MKTKLLLTVAALFSTAFSVSAQMGELVTYQGVLASTGAPLTGAYDLRFTIYDSVAGLTVVSGPTTNSAVGVTNGLFTTPIAVSGSSAIFNGADRWLEIAVRPSGGGAFVTLAPRQPFTPTPFAFYGIRAGVAGVATLANSVATGSITSAALAPGAVTQLSSPGGTIPSAVQVSTNGFVGIGTNAPNAALEITGGASVIGLTVYATAVDGTGTFTNLTGASGLAASGNLLAVAAASDNAVTLVDSASSTLTYRSSMLQGQGSFTNLTGAQGVAFGTNNLLAVAAPTANAVTLVDASNPATPVWRAALRNGAGGWNDLTGAGAVAFKTNLLAIAAQGANAVTLADVSNPAAPVQRVVMRNGAFGFNSLGGPNAVAFSGNLLAISAWTSNAVTLADVTNPASPVPAGVLNSANGFIYLTRPWSLAFDGNLLAIGGYYYDAVTLADVSNPAAPVLRAVIRNGVGGVSRFVSPLGLAFLHRNGRTLLAVGARDSAALSVFDVTDPAHPLLRGTFLGGQSGLDYLSSPRGVVFNANGQLAIEAYNSPSAVTLLDLPDQKVGLVSDTWVGIGTTAPKAALDVSGDVLVENANRFEVDATHVQVGTGTTAAGQYATAVGYSSSASGDYSTALGYSTTASGTFATALGYNSTASGRNSLAVGTSAVASHDATFVWNDNSSGTFASTAPNQFLIHAGGGLGINKNNPATALDVNGTIAATAVGIGTTTPTDGILDVEGASHFNDFDLYLRGGSDRNHGLGWYGAGKSFPGFNSDGPILYGCSGGALGTFCGTPHATLTWDSGTVYVNGNSGATNALVADSATLNNGTLTPGLLFGGSGSGEGISSKRTSGGNLFGLDFYTGFNTRMRIFSGGSVSIGGTNADHLLDVNGNIASRGSLVVNSHEQQDNSFPEVPGILFGNYGSTGEVITSQRGTNGVNQYGLDFYTSHAKRLIIAGNGNVGIGRQPTANRLEVAGNASKDVAGSWLANSDARIKTDVQPVTGALEKLDKVRLVSFNYTDTYRQEHPSVEPRRYVNVVAQEFREIFPDDVKSSGEKLADGSEILQVDTYPLTIYSAAAVQELNQKLTAGLKRRDAENAELKARLERLEKLINARNGGGR